MTSGVVCSATVFTIFAALLCSVLRFGSSNFDLKLIAGDKIFRRRKMAKGRVNRRRGFPFEAIIKVADAKAILPVPFTGVTTKDRTWYDFLAENGLQLTPNDGVYVRTKHCKDLTGKNKWYGFTAELDEQIGTFLAKYKVYSMNHSVRLMRRKPPAINFKPPRSKTRKNVSVAGGSRQGQQNRVTSRGGPGSRLGGGIGTGNQGSSLRAKVISRAAKLAERQFVGRLEEESGQLMLQTVKLENVEEVEVPQQVGEEERDADDAMSVWTSMSEEAGELQRRGISSEDLKNPAKGRLNGVENGFLLRVRQEIRRLKGDNSWIRNYQRSPLACYLLEQLLKP